MLVLLWSGGSYRDSVLHAQQPPVSTPQQTARPPLFGGQEESNDPAERSQQEKLEKGRQEERQKQLVRDTDRLFELAQQLKDQVAKSNKNTLSIDIVKKAAEIEKLAKSVKERMRG